MSTVVEYARASSREIAPNSYGPILAATDGRPECASVLDAARALGTRLGADVQVIAVAPALAPIVPDPRLLLDLGVMPRMRADLGNRVRAQCATAWADEPAERVPPDVDIREGQPDHVIARLANERDAQLIVIGLGRHDVVERIFGDETALKVIRESQVPVLAVPDQYRGAPHSALVGVDFSEMSVRAAQVALRLLSEGGLLRLVHVIPHARTILDGVIPREEQERFLRHRFTQFIGRLTIPPNIEVGEVTLDGDPARKLLAYAAESGADLVAAGSHGHGFVARLVIGSVTTKLLRGGECAVLVVPPAPSRVSGRAAERGVTMRFESARWAEVLDDFTRCNVGRRTRLEVDDPSIGAQAQEQDYRLLGVAFDAHDQRVEIMLGELGGGEPHLSRGIAGVESLHLLTDNDGRDLALRLRHGAGQTILTLLR
jgi:nucleotide-binding universal stress UspA family protein